MSDQFEAFKEWVSTIREDIETIKSIVETEKVDEDARKFAATALNYLVARMDLVPDWEESVGVLDDVMVLRVCLELAGQHGLDEQLEDSDIIVAVGRLSNEVKLIEDYLGAELYAHFRKYCARQSSESVRGRSPETVVNDAEARAALYSEVDAELLRMPAAPFSDPEALSLKFRSYLHHKLNN